jgi:DNA-binding NarL/FixJ family response regulator
MTTVLLVDDHPVFRKGLRALLEELELQVVGEAGDGAAGLDLAVRLRPDVVLMDIHMPDVDGVEATRRLLAQWPEAQVLILTMAADDSAVFAAIQAGALGYLLKGSGLEEIDRAVTAVSAGQAVYGPEVARRLRAFFTSGGGAAKPFPELTDRERDVLTLVADGLNNTEIGRRLFLSEKTVRNRVSDVFSKLAVSSRAEAVVAARNAGLGSTGGTAGGTAGPGRS